MTCQKSDIVNCLLTDIIPAIVEGVRADLSKQYDVLSDEYHKFSGLCEEASSMVISGLKDYLTNQGFSPETDFDIHSIHGEQKHRPAIQSKHWAIQHTWVYLNILGTKIYVDPTSSQFINMYDDIPPYYVSTDAPKWFYSDRKNPAWNGITGKLNMKRFIKRKVKLDGKVFTCHDGIIEFMQYEIWGKISDAIRKLK